MRKELLEMVWILDRSGSMSGLEGDTIGGFNSMNKRQLQLPGEVYVSTVLFNSYSLVLHDRVPINDIEPLTEKDYVPSGCTALLDAIGDAIHHIENIHKYARPEDVPEKTMFIITTDGYENASRRYGADEIRATIKRKQEEHGWEFLFLGANIDAIETAEQIGINQDRAANYLSDSIGIRHMTESISMAAETIRECRPLDASWKANIEADYESRYDNR